MGHVDVRLHPPHTIRNSIQLQAALAIPQVCSLSCKLACTLGGFGGGWMNGACSLAEVCEGHRVHCTCHSLHCDARVWVILFLIYRHTDFLILPLLKTHNMYVLVLQKPLKNTLQKLACVVVSTAALCTAVVC